MRSPNDQVRMSDDRNLTRGRRPEPRGSARPKEFERDGEGSEALFYACDEFSTCTSAPIPADRYDERTPPECATHGKPMTTPVKPKP
jgi:hypothetical protein